MTTAQQELGVRLGRFFESNGLPRSAGRLLGHLLTCEPPEQTFEQLVQAAGASRSTVSVATRLLVQLGLVERFGVHGERRDRYRLGPDPWTSLLRQDVESAAELKRLASDGLRALAPAPTSVRVRLRTMRAFYAFLEASYQPVLRRWERRGAAAPTPRRRR